ncbi:MAG: hypothetical protein LBC61_00970 [Candidatus Peribacteria bacterium]|jgi:hypothetical protein|nr:hypothetical protein [Candidatus Peribacteria bacterium]
MSYYGNVIYPERNKYFTINFNTFEEFENVNNISLEDILQKDFLINEMEGFTEKEVPFLPRYIYVNITKSPIIFRYEIDN